MSHPIRKALSWVCALLALVSLVSCGGGAEPDAQSVPQTLSFSAPASQTFGAAPLTLLATSSSGLAVSFASTPLVCARSAALC